MPKWSPLTQVHKNINPMLKAYILVDKHIKADIDTMCVCYAIVSQWIVFSTSHNLDLPDGHNSIDLSFIYVYSLPFSSKFLRLNLIILLKQQPYLSNCVCCLIFIKKETSWLVSLYCKADQEEMSLVCLPWKDHFLY